MRAEGRLSQRIAAQFHVEPISVASVTRRFDRVVVCVCQHAASHHRGSGQSRAADAVASLAAAGPTGGVEGGPKQVRLVA